jgi:hypothetical protein
MSSDYSKTKQNGFVLNTSDPDYKEILGEVNVSNDYFIEKNKTVVNADDATYAKFKNIQSVQDSSKDHFIKGTGTKILTWNYLIDIPVKNINDLLSKLGIMHGTHLKLNLQIHSATTTFKLTDTAISDIVIDAPYGTCPYLVNRELIEAGAILSAATIDTITIRSGIVKAYGSAAAVPNPLANICSYRACMITPRPEYDADLVSRPVMKLNYNNFITKIDRNIQPNKQFKTQITNSLSRGKFLLVHFRHAENMNGSKLSTDVVFNATDSNPTSFSTQASPFNSSPCTSKAHCSVGDIQLEIGSTRLYDRDLLSDIKVIYDETFMAKSALDGGMDVSQSSGLVNQALYEKQYAGIMVFDLEKYTTLLEWVNTKDLQFSFKNTGLNPIDVMFQLHSSEDLSINTNTGYVVKE